MPDQYTLNQLCTLEGYSADNVNVTVKWTQQAGVVYYFRVLPLAPLMFNGSSSVQLVLEYNTEYNISVMAVGPCEVDATAAISLSYGEAYVGAEETASTIIMSLQL